MTEASLSQTVAPRSFPGLRLGFDRLLILALVLGVWEILSRTIVDPFWISSPSAVVVRLAKLTANGDLVWHTVATVRQAVFGLALGILVGTAGGALLARARRVSNACSTRSSWVSTACRASRSRRCSSCGSASACSRR